MKIVPYFLPIFTSLTENHTFKIFFWSQPICYLYYFYPQSVNSAGIRTHNHSVINPLPQPLDHGSSLASYSSCLYLNGKTFVILQLKGIRCFLGFLGFCWANSRIANLSNIQLVMTILDLSVICKIHLHSNRNIFRNYLINLHSIKLHKNGLFKCLLHSLPLPPTISKFTKIF